MPRGTYGNGKPKASKGRAKMRARRKLWKRVSTESGRKSPGKLAGIATHKKMMGGLSEPNKVVPGGDFR